MPKKKPKTSLPNIDAKNVRARSIELVDSKGKTKVRFTTSSATANSPEMTVIQLCGRDGLPKIELQVIDNSPGIRLVSESGNVGFTVALNEDSHGMTIANKKGLPAIQLGIYHEDSGDGPQGTKPALILSDFDQDTTSLEVSTKECTILQPAKKTKRPGGNAKPKSK